MAKGITHIEFELKPAMHVHLVGIGGSGISAIARVLLGRGFTVSGSDQQGNALTEALKDAGATIYIGHKAEQIAGANALVISSAIPVDNPEIAAARSMDIPVLKRADFLGHLMKDKVGIAISGSHGKTTTTGMITQILLKASVDPTVIVGGVLPTLGTNGRYGQGPHFVIEADEYDNMFLGLKPSFIVLTSIEHDHPDVFPTISDYLHAFQQFVALLPSNGHLIACVDDEGVNQLLTNTSLNHINVIQYSLDSDTPAEYRALDIRSNSQGGSDFLIERSGQIIGLARIRVPGTHNVSNALAATIVGLQNGFDFSVIRTALADFGGMVRRFEITGTVGGVTIIDDYAHHPTAIRTTLAAARQRFPGRRLWAVWQPHTYSRTKLLLSEFANSFDQADRVIALDIYRSREEDMLGINTAVVIQAMNHPYAIHIPNQADAATYIIDRVRPDDVILTLGAGDGHQVGEWVLDALKNRVYKSSKYERVGG